MLDRNYIPAEKLKSVGKIIFEFIVISIVISYLLSTLMSDAFNLYELQTYYKYTKYFYPKTGYRIFRVAMEYGLIYIISSILAGFLCMIEKSKEYERKYSEIQIAVYETAVEIEEEEEVLCKNDSKE